MNYKDELRETEGLVKDLGKTVEKLNNQVNNALKQLPEEKRSQIRREISTFSKVAKEAKKGNIDKMHEIINRYAGTDKSK